MLRGSLSVATLALLLTSLSSAQAQNVQVQFVETPGLFRRPNKTITPVTNIDVPMPRLKIKKTGLLASRLSDKHRLRWKAITDLVLAQTPTGTPLHPVLSELWRWADSSSHIIQVELIESTNIQSSSAGSFNIEQFDPTGRCHRTTLKLYISNIDVAVSGPQVARRNGFIPFAGLRKEERYAEVLGHELAHVKYVLSNAMRSHLVHELVETTNDLLLLHARTRPMSTASPEMKQRLIQRDALLREIEPQAESIEEVVWQELTASKKTRTNLIPGTRNHRR